MIEDYMKLKSVKRTKAFILNAFDTITDIFNLNHSQEIVFYTYPNRQELPDNSFSFAPAGPHQFNVSSSANHKFLVIRNDRIGDLVLSIGAIRSLRQRFPFSHITFLGSEENASLIKSERCMGQPLVNDFIALTPFWRKGNRNLHAFRKYLATLAYIRKQKYDAGIDLRCSMLNIIFFLWMGNVKKRVSYYNFNGGKAFLTDPVFYDKHEHNVKSLHKLLEKGFKIRFPFYEPELQGNHLLTPLNYICICPGAGNPLQRWPAAKFDALIKEIKKKTKLDILLIGGKDDARLITRLRENNPSCFTLINQPLDNLPIFFRNAECVIANDGGAMHMAWASGAKVIALWGPTDLEHIGPLKNSTVIIHRMPCMPCIKLRKSCIRRPGERCMDSITVKEVFNEIRNICGKNI